MKKVSILILVMSILFTGCNGKSSYTDKGTETKLTAENTDDGQSSENKEGFSTELSSNFYKTQVDSDTGERKFGLFLGENILYEGNEVEIGAGIRADMGLESYTEIPVLCMLVLDGRLIPFSVDGSPNEITHRLLVNNAEEKKFTLKFMPYGVCENEEKQLLFIAVPFYDKNSVELYENDLIYCAKKIESSKGNLDAENYLEGKDYFFKDDIESYYGQELPQISEHYGEVFDYLVQNEKEELYYVADYPEGKYETIIICDGELYNGFDGCPYLIWDKKENGYMNKKIDITGLAKGSHVLSVITIDNNYQDNYMAFKSMNKEVNVDD